MTESDIRLRQLTGRTEFVPLEKPVSLDDQAKKEQWKTAWLLEGNERAVVVACLVYTRGKTIPGELLIVEEEKITELFFLTVEPDLFLPNQSEEERKKLEPGAVWSFDKTPENSYPDGVVFRRRSQAEEPKNKLGLAVDFAEALTRMTGGAIEVFPAPFGED